MYCWEAPFKRIIENIRKKEIKYQGLFYVVTSFNNVMVICGPTLMTFVSIAFFINFAHVPLSPQFIVLATSFYMKLNGSLGFFFIKQIQFLITASVSLKRIQDFLMEAEVKKSNTYNPSTNPVVKFENIWSSWTDVSFRVRVTIKYRLYFV